MDAVHLAGLDELSRVDELDIQLLGHGAQTLAQLAAVVDAGLIRHIVFLEGQAILRDLYRRDQQDLHLLAGTVDPQLSCRFQHILHGACGGDGIAGGNIGLKIVGAQHKDQYINRSRAAEDRGHGLQTVQLRIKGIVKDGGASGETFLDHGVVLIAQLFLQAGRPADALVISLTGNGNIAPGIGIAETDNAFFHMGGSSLSCFVRSAFCRRRLFRR